MVDRWAYTLSRNSKKDFFSRNRRNNREWELSAADQYEEEVGGGGRNDTNSSVDYTSEIN